MNEQRDRVFELVPTTKDRRDVRKIEWSQMLLNNRPQKRILPHRADL